MSDYLDINNEELLKDFFAEADQQVELLESNTLVIEQDPTNKDAVDEIFRAAHTLKGGSATVEMTEISSFTHAIEDLLDEIRSDKVKVTEQIIDLLLAGIDTVKEMLQVRKEGGVYTEDVSAMANELRSYVSSKPKTRAPKVAKPATAKPTSLAKGGEILTEYERLELAGAVPSDQKVYQVSVNFDESNQMNTVGGIQVYAALKQCSTVLKTLPDFDELYEDVFHPNVIYIVSSGAPIESIDDVANIPDVTLGVEVKVVDLSGDAAVSKPQKEKPTEAPKDSNDAKPEVVSSKKQTKQQPTVSHQTSSILRVDSKRIDYLLNLVSEAVITKASLNQNTIEFNDLYVAFQTQTYLYKDQLRKLMEKIPSYLERIQAGADLNVIKKELSDEYVGMFDIFSGVDSNFKQAINKFKSASQNLGRITGELQEGVMKIRMVPISQIFNRFPRVVRDLCKDLNKKVQLVIEGEDTELDKSVVEDLLDPIMHCVRNSIDHGIEVPDVRKKQGKNEEGTILLRASNEGNMIVIEVADDGHGIDVESVKRKAIERGVIHPDKNLTDIEAFQLIFEPGFSTSKKVTNVSGRGVGLDVVRTHIENLNGSVFVESELNAGTRFVIKLPLTLAIIEGLLIKVGNEIYSIPIPSVVESVRVSDSEISTIDNYEVFNCRDEVISLLRLSRLFGISSIQHEAREDDNNYIVIVGSDEKKVGLMVDTLIGKEDVVIKPLTDQFTNSPGIAGASILGDGSVSLIIDVAQLLDLGMRQEINARQRRDASVW
ncbi:MAG: chemotaxis protein CheA [Treponemataceae bacterium]